RSSTGLVLVDLHGAGTYRHVQPHGAEGCQRGCSGGSGNRGARVAGQRALRPVSTLPGEPNVYDTIADYLPPSDRYSVLSIDQSSLGADEANLTHPGGSIIKRIAMAPVATLFFGVKYIEGYVRDRLSHFAAGSLPLLTRWLHAMAAAMHYTYAEYNRFATQWADDFAVFRHKT